MDQVNTQIQDCTVQMEQALQESNNASSGAAKLASDQEAYIKKQSLLRELEIRNVQGERVLKGAKEKMERLFEHRNSRLGVFSDKSSNLQKEYEAALTQFEKQKPIVTEMDEKCLQLDQEVLVFE